MTQAQHLITHSWAVSSQEQEETRKVDRLRIATRQTYQRNWCCVLPTHAVHQRRLVRIPSRPCSSPSKPSASSAIKTTAIRESLPPTNLLNALQPPTCRYRPQLSTLTRIIWPKVASYPTQCPTQVSRRVKADKTKGAKTTQPMPI